MRIAVTGGTGFVGRHLARALADEGHEAVLIARGERPRTDDPRVRFVAASVEDEGALRAAFEGCDGVAHCAGINREIGRQTYANIHVEGTRAVVRAALASGAKKIALLSFLRARPACGSGYHESKWAAEEIVRGSGLDYTILKSGVIYGRGDHMLDHLSHAFHTFPLFGLVGFRDPLVAPVAVEDVARILKAALAEDALSRMTVPVLGPERLTLSGAVKRVAAGAGKNPLYIRLPVWSHALLGRLFEWTMNVPLVSKAQVRILSEGLVDPAGKVDPLPSAFAPRIPFTLEQIRKGLPLPTSFGFSDLRCCRAR